MLWPLWGRYDIVIAAFRNYGGDIILSLQLLQLFVIIGAIVHCRPYGGDMVFLLQLLHLFAIAGAILSCYCNCYNCSQNYGGDITTRAVPLQYHRSNRFITHDRKGRPLGAGALPEAALSYYIIALYYRNFAQSRGRPCTVAAKAGDCQGGRPARGTAARPDGRPPAAGRGGRAGPGEERFRARSGGGSGRGDPARHRAGASES